MKNKQKGFAWRLKPGESITVDQIEIKNDGQYAIKLQIKINSKEGELKNESIKPEQQ